MSRQRFVVDSSVFASVVVKDAFHERASRFLRRTDVELATLDLAFIEVFNALWKHAYLLRRLSEEQCFALKRLVKPLILNSVARVYGSLDLLEEALEDAARYEVTVYDALYVALAKKLEAELVSRDEEQVKVAEKAGVKASLV